MLAWQLTRCLPYPGSIRRAFREKVKRAGKQGRCQLRGWPEIVIGTVIKKTAKHHVVEVIRCMAQGTLEQAEEFLALSAGGIQLNTAFIERFNGTMRERLASLTRRSRHAARRLAALDAGMWLVGCTYNFCWPHHELSRRIARAQGRRGEALISPAMAAGLTDHLWSVRELLSFRLAPPPYVAPKRRGRPKKTDVGPSRLSSGRPRPLLRLRKGVSPDRGVLPIDEHHRRNQPLYDFATTIGWDWIRYDGTSLLTNHLAGSKIDKQKSHVPRLRSSILMGAMGMERRSERRCPNCKILPILSAVRTTNVRGVLATNQHNNTKG